MKKFLTLMLVVLMALPLAVMASAAVPAEPAAVNEPLAFVSHGTNTNFPNVAVSDAGGDSPENAYKVANKDNWTALLTSTLAAGGKAVVVGKTFFSEDTVFPATAKPLVLTAEFGGVNYSSFKEDGSYNATTAATWKTTRSARS